MKPVIHWFRRDLRLTDNPALYAASKSSRSVVPVYIVSEWSGRHRWTGPNRQSFLCGSLESLSKNLSAIGGRLIIRRGPVVEELEKLIHESGAGGVYFNRVPDPFGREVEAKVLAVARRLGCEVRSFHEAGLIEPDGLLTAAGESYRVFTPYYRAWLKKEKPVAVGAVRHLQTPEALRSLPLPGLKTWALDEMRVVDALEPGESAARRRMKEFLSHRIGGYAAGRDIPSLQATSRLSQDFRFGLISIREVVGEVFPSLNGGGPYPVGAAAKFLSELAWRDFYFQILWHYPEVLEREFNPVFQGMSWPGREADFARWVEGTTGFPIVDAAMRELSATGHMHNRARMIAAMFLVKDLHMDWRSGEQVFLQKLVDGEIASNNGGWQWCAGTGADAAPYFRIQNPWTQTKSYDPDGRYIKKWLPELRDLPAKSFQFPPAAGTRLARGYPPPIVDHAAARNLTLDLFASARRR